MKIAIGSFVHESHSFSQSLTTKELMEIVAYDGPDVIIDKHRGVRGQGGGAYVGGYVDYAESHGWEMVPLFVAGAYPCGPVTYDTYADIKKKIIDGLKDVIVDGVVLHLHGAAVVQDIDDAEGDLLEAIRETVGDTPVLTIMDLHANVSEKMIANADAIFGYDTYPHVDPYERQQEVCELLDKMVNEGVRPVMYRAQPPQIICAMTTSTEVSPMKDIMEKAFDFEKEEGVINVSAFAGYYGSDKPHTGASAVVITDNDPAKAERIAKAMADEFWSRRQEFIPTLPTLDEALEIAMSNDGTFGFVDECDDPLGGGAADGTGILAGLIERGVKSVGVSTIKDPEIVNAAWEVGVGGTVTGLLGGKTDKLHGEPVEINAKVLMLTDKEVPMMDEDASTTQNVGKIALIDNDGIQIIVTEYTCPTELTNLFAHFGIDVSQYKILILKGSSEGYKATYGDKLAEYIVPESAGITNPDVTKVGEFKYLRRPIFPINENVEMRYE